MSSVATHRGSDRRTARENTARLALLRTSGLGRHPSRAAPPRHPLQRGLQGGGGGAATSRSGAARKYEPSGKITVAFQPLRAKRFVLLLDLELRIPVQKRPVHEDPRGRRVWPSAALLEMNTRQFWENYHLSRVCRLGIEKVAGCRLAVRPREPGKIEK